MDLEAFHLAQPLWLWGALAIPAVWAAFFLVDHLRDSSQRLESMIDRHLLPFLLVPQNRDNITASKGKLVGWSLLWVCLMLALAGPRWSFREIETATKAQSLVILLDLSESMEATDVKPSRLARAKQRIEDLIQNSEGVKIGLIAFAADPHVIAPLTDDKETLRHLLSSLNTEVVYIQGSRLSPALQMAARMLAAERTSQQAIVLVSDGGFEDSSALAEVKKLAEQGIALHAIGIGTLEGTLLRDRKGGLLKKNEKTVLSKLERAPLQEISKAGRGLYMETHHSPYNETDLLAQLQKGAETVATGKQMRLWDEGFLFFLLPLLPLFLYGFRRGVILTGGAALLLFPPSLQAEGLSSYFKNSEEIGKEAFEKGDYEKAFQAFQDPYRKGVSCYQAGDFAEAENLFKQSVRSEVACHAGYNLGNALAQQQKFQEAITAYEEVLKKWPDHQPTKENLELIRKILEQQKKEEPPENSKEEPKNGEKKKDEEKESSPPEREREESAEAKPEQKKSQEDLDADVWLNRLPHDSTNFLKNKFYLESKKNGTSEGIDPW